MYFYTIFERLYKYFVERYSLGIINVLFKHIAFLDPFIYILCAKWLRIIWMEGPLHKNMNAIS